MRQLLPAIAAIGLCTPATAAELHLEPASSWQVDNAPNLCRLSRDYAAGEERITLRLEQFRPGAGVQAVLITDRVVRKESLAPFRIRLGATAPFRTPAFPLVLPDGRRAMLMTFELVKPSETSEHTWPDEKALTAIDKMEFSAPVMGTLVFQTRTLVRAMAEMRTCAVNMVREWGFDPVQQASLSRQPKPSGSTQRWLQWDDFKRLGPAPGQLDHLIFRLDVDATGKPVTCHIVRSYSDPAFAQRSCELLMQRARFSPALDAAGQPVASYWLSRASHL